MKNGRKRGGAKRKKKERKSRKSEATSVWDGNNIAVAVENKLVGTMSMGRIIQRCVYGRENPKIRVWEGGSKVVCMGRET